MALTVIRSNQRQIMWIITAIIMIALLVNPIGLPIPVTDEIKLAVSYLDELPEGSNVLIQGDVGAGYWYETGIGMIAVMKHCFKNNLKIYSVHFAAITPDAPGSTERALKLALISFPNKVQGVDYVNLGFATGAASTVLLFAEDARKVFTHDNFGTPIDEIPMMEGINDISDFDIVYVMPGPWGNTLYYIYPDLLQPLEIPLISVCLTMDVPMILPFRTAELTNAYIGGTSGNAQYEYLIGQYGRAFAMMDVQNAILIFMLIAAVSSNIYPMLERLKEEEKS